MVEAAQQARGFRGFVRGAGAKRVAQRGHQFLSHGARQVHEALHLGAARSPVETQNQIFRRAARHALQQNLQTFELAIPAQHILQKFRHAFFQPDARAQALREDRPLVLHRVQRIERLQQRGEQPLQARFLRQAHKRGADEPLQIVVALDAQLRPGYLNRRRERTASERSVHVGEIRDADRRSAPRLEFVALQAGGVILQDRERRFFVAVR